MLAPDASGVERGQWKIGLGNWISMNMLDSRRQMTKRLIPWARTKDIHNPYTRKLFDLTSKQRNVNEKKAIPYCTYQMAKITGKENSQCLREKDACTENELPYL